MAGYARPMALAITWQQALAWRMRRHLLDPVGRRPVADVVALLCGVQAQVASSAELAVRVRRQSSRRGEVERALRDGRLIKTWAMRGTLHLLRAEDAGVFLSLVASGRSWERPSWQRYFGMTPRQMDALLRAVRDALEDGPLTRDDLVTAIVARRGLRHLGEGLRSGWGTLLKPLAWQGDLCFGASRGARVTFMRPEDASPRWGGLPDPEEAAPEAIAAYLRAYGPATIEAFGNWLAGGWFGKRHLRAWFGALGPPARAGRRGRRARVRPRGGSRRAGLDGPDRIGAPAAGLRPVRPRPRHGGRPRRTAAPTRARSAARRGGSRRSWWPAVSSAGPGSWTTAACA